MEWRDYKTRLSDAKSMELETCGLRQSTSTKLLCFPYRHGADRLIKAPTGSKSLLVHHWCVARELASGVQPPRTVQAPSEPFPLSQKYCPQYHSWMKAVGFVVLTSNDSHLTWPKVMGLSRRSREARLKLETTHWIFSRKVIPSTIYMFISCCIHLTTRFVDHRKILLTWSQVNDLIQRILFVSNSQCIPLLVQWRTW
jgi:hypothetical protein